MKPEACRACALAALVLGHPVVATGQDLAGSEWRPQTITAEPQPTDVQMFVRFGGGGELSGHAACNRFVGRYRAADGVIAVHGLGETRMRCDDRTMAREAAFLAALQSARRFRRDGIRLILADGDGVVVAGLIQTDWD